MSEIVYGPISWERMIGAVEDVRNRLVRATTALKNANIDYAVVGGNAVAAWVSRIDRAAVRNTRDVDLLLRREDLDAAKRALAPAGFIYRHVKGIDMIDLNLIDTTWPNRFSSALANRLQKLLNDPDG